ncbi:GNAT family N-acetyltransferase [Streptomyces anulatus]|uniref:GNAT family N-acetyltransferase n=1 Tax=Streptomyces anulatus TaxID=1892 RepID=UPI002E82222A|nr:GNAT family N-acetyltransferase [Streptomyces anulatus]WUC86110.1 GNAT family N-acetyltransferase [Streptomyces anulatus]
MAWEIHTARNEEDVRRCWPVFRELRPHIASEDEFVGRWKVQQDEAYRIVFLEQDGEVRAAAGFRIVHSMARGRAVYLDDLCALTEHQGAGLGRAVLGFVQDEARRLGCGAVHLDTGYHRRRAHRTYLRSGFELSLHHLEWKATEA